MIYLASPYTSKHSEVQIQRVEDVAKAAAFLQVEGIPVYSPVAHSAMLVRHVPQDLIDDHSFWMQHCIQMLDAASALWVLAMPGWDFSKGVLMEIEHAKRTNKPAMLVHDWLTHTRNYTPL